MAELGIKISQSEVELKLSKKGRVIDLQTAKYYHDLSEVLTPLEVTAIIKKGHIKKGTTVIYKELLTGLITSIDKLLKRTRIDATALKSFKIKGNLGQDSTSYKIAQAFIEGLKVSC